MIRATRIGTVLLLCFFACTRSLTPEEKSKVEALSVEVESVHQEVVAAQSELAQYSGGLVKGLLQVRLEILKVTEALIQQRIHAIEAGSPVNVQTIASTPNLERASQLAEEIQKQEAELQKAQQESAKYSGGLVKAFAEMAVATNNQTLAILRQQYLVAKLGLSMPAFPDVGASKETASAVASASPPPPPPDPETKLRKEIVTVRLLQKKFTTQEYQEFIFFDLEYNPSGLDKPARAVKGTLNLTDLFGETKLALSWTIDEPLRPGSLVVEKSMGFKFNQFLGPHLWARATELNNMSAIFTVNSILYEDGTRKEWE